MEDGRVLGQGWIEPVPVQVVSVQRTAMTGRLVQRNEKRKKKKKQF